MAITVVCTFMSCPMVAFSTQRWVRQRRNLATTVSFLYHFLQFNARDLNGNICLLSAPDVSSLHSSRLTRDADVQTLDNSADEEIKEDFTYLAMGTILNRPHENKRSKTFLFFLSLDTIKVYFDIV